MELIEFYKGILETIGFQVDGHSILLDQGTVKTPCQIEGRNLVLPTREILANPDWKTQMAFHPLSENIARKDSVVLKRLQRLANLAVNLHTGDIIRVLIDYCADTDSHNNLNHKQNVFLEYFPDADATALKNWDKIINVIGESKQFVKLITLRDKKLNDEFNSRVCFVKFPFLEECEKALESKTKDYQLFGIKVRKKDLNGFKRLFEFVFKDADKADEVYSAGTRGSLAPSFQVLAQALYNLTKALEKVYRLLRIDYPDLRWGEELENLSQYKGLIPPLDGNEGELTEGERRRNQLMVEPPAPQKKTTTGPNVISQVNPPTPSAPTPPPVAKIIPVAQPAPKPAPAPTPSPAANPVPAHPPVSAPAQGARIQDYKVIKQSQPPQFPAAGQPQMPGQPVAGYPYPAYPQPMQYAQPVQYAAPQQAYMGPYGMQRPVDVNGRPISIGYGNQAPVAVNRNMMPNYGYNGYNGYGVNPYYR